MFLFLILKEAHVSILIVAYVGMNPFGIRRGEVCISFSLILRIELIEVFVVFFE